MMDYFWNATSPNGNSFDLLLFIAASAIKATLLLGFVALLCSQFRRASAATRHMLWTLSLCAVLLFPFLSVLKVWEVPVLSVHTSSQSEARAVAAGDAVSLSAARRGKGMTGAPSPLAGEQSSKEFQPLISSTAVGSPAASIAGVFDGAQKGVPFYSKLAVWALALWFAGVLVFLLKLMVGYTATRLLTRSAVEFKDPSLIELFSSLLTRLRLKSKVSLLRSRRTSMPIVCGVLRPAVLLPADADAWSEERRGMVLLHELKHVSRRDCLTQMLAQAACVLYWFNPLVWYAARRLRVEREQACDDYVLSSGTRPSDYAHHLLEIARSLRERPSLGWSQTTTVAMARQSQLEWRLRAILSKEGKRRGVSRMMTAAAASLMFGLFVSLALVQPTTGMAHSSQLSEARVSGGAASGPFLNERSAPVEVAAARDLSAEDSDHVHEGSLGIAAADSKGKTLADGAVNSDLKPSARVDALPYPWTDPDENTAHPTEEVIVPETVPVTEPPVESFTKVRGPQKLKTSDQDKSVDFIDEMASVGYTNLSVDELIRLKSSGVTAEYVKGLSGAGFAHLPVRDLVSWANNGVTPDYIKAIRAAGYNDLSVSEISSFRNNDITPEYIKALREAGYGNLPVRMLVSFAANAVTPSFINGIRAAGFSNLSAADIISLRANDITPEFIRKARSRLGELTLRQIISLKNAGILNVDEDK